MSLEEELKQLQQQYDINYKGDEIAINLIDEVLRLLRVRTEKIRSIFDNSYAISEEVNEGLKLLKKKVLAQLTTSLSEEQVARETPNDFGWHSSDYKEKEGEKE